MRLIALASLALCGLVACSHPTTDDASQSGASADSEDSGASSQGACSLEYWHWVLNTLEPQLARPATEVSDADLTALVAKHPDPAYTKDGYGVCWAPLFNQYFTGNALYTLHNANTIFVDQKSPDYRSYPRYLANITMSDEVRRNAKALLALRPATMQPTDSDIWASTYSDVLAESIHPVGIPGLMEYDDVVEAEWVLSTPEQDYLAVVEGARADAGADGVYGEWIANYGKWIFGPPPAVTRSFVFNLPWEPGAESDSYGLSGVVLDNGDPMMPAPVSTFVDRLKATAPTPIGSEDTGAWWAIYNGRALRAMGDLSQNQPVLTKTDILALDVMESVEPAAPRGLFAYQTWQSLMTVAASIDDDQWTKRFAALEPCVDASDLADAGGSAKACP